MKRETSAVLSFILIMLFIVVGHAQTGSPAAQSAAAKAGSTNNETEIRDLYDRWAKAFSARDLDGIMAVYAPGAEVVAYDVVPPLQYSGNAAYRKDYQDFLALYDGPIDIEFRDMRIVAGEDVAFLHALERISGKMKNGQQSDFWLRATSGLRKINGRWLIVHDHISVPVDLDTGKAELGLKPPAKND
jgi:uncharacterized protein (TIGR02246 family)